MRPNDPRKNKSRPKPNQGLKQTLEGILEGLRDGLDQLVEELARGLQPKEPELIPIPIPVDRPRRR
jgi:hypothetical protein